MFYKWLDAQLLGLLGITLFKIDKKTGETLTLFFLIFLHDNFFDF